MKELIEVLKEEADRRVRDYDSDTFMFYTALYFRYVAAWLEKEHGK